MNIIKTLFPKAGDEPRQRFSGTGNDIPILDLSSDWCLQFQADKYDDAVAYLDHLADAATDLAAQIRRRQRGLARLLDVVEATDEAGAR